MDYLVVVCGDTNDGDYTYRRVHLSTHEMEQYRPLLVKVASAVSESTTSSNWPNNEYCDETVYEKYVGILSEDEIMAFNEIFVPYGEIGIHSLESITVYKISHVEEIY